jgi:hypothetical protein
MLVLEPSRLSVLVTSDVDDATFRYLCLGGSVGANSREWPDRITKNL